MSSGIDYQLLFKLRAVIARFWGNGSGTLVEHPWTPGASRGKCTGAVFLRRTTSLKLAYYLQSPVSGAKSFTIHPRPSRSGVSRRILRTSLRITGNDGLENLTCGARSFRTSRQSRMICKRHFEVRGLVSQTHLDTISKLRRTAEGRALALPGDSPLCDETIILLAAGFYPR